MKSEYSAFKARLEDSQMLAGKVFPVVRRDKNGVVRANYVTLATAGPDEIHTDSFSYVSSAESDSRYTWDVRVVATDYDTFNGSSQMSG